MKLFYVCYENLTAQAAWTTHIKEVVENWHRSGIEVVLFSPRFGKLKTDLDFKRAYIPAIRIRVLGEYLYYVVLFLYLILYQIREKADVIYVREMSCCLPAALVMVLFRVPLIIEVNGAILFERKLAGASSAKIAFFRILHCLNLVLCHRIVVVAEHLKHYLLANFQVDESKIIVIENGVNPDLFKPLSKKEVRQALNLPQDCHHLAYVGNFYPHHCLAYIINVLPFLVKKIDRLKVILVGDGLEREKVLGLVKKLELESYVHYTGQVDYEDVPKWINAADACLIFSRGGHAQGLKLLEYLACGVPVISNFQTVFESSQDEFECGVQVDLKNMEDAADKIAHFLRNEADREEMGANARRFIIRERSWKKTAMKIIDVCREVCH